MSEFDSLWLKQVLDSIPAEIAVLDPQGNIIFVNREWRRFGEVNSGPGDAFLGSNYLSACLAAAKQGDESAAAVAGAIQEILNGEKESFAIEYPCDSSEGRLWFRMLLCVTGARHVIVQHIDITARVEAEHRLRQIFAAVAEGIVVSGNHGEIVAVNPAAENLLALPEEVLIGKKVEEVLPLPEGKAGLRCQVFVQGVAVQAACFTFADRSGKFLVWTLTENPERAVPKAMHSLDAHLSEYISLLEAAPAATAFEAAAAYTNRVEEFVDQLYQKSVSPIEFVPFHTRALQRATATVLPEESRLLLLRILTELGGRYHREVCWRA